MFKTLFIALVAAVRLEAPVSPADDELAQFYSGSKAGAVYAMHEAEKNGLKGGYVIDLKKLFWRSQLLVTIFVKVIHYYKHSYFILPDYSPFD